MLLAGREIAPGTGHEEGRALLAELYRQYSGAALPPILIGGRGKPYFENGPYFSITHTKTHVFCALSEKPIGIDAEAADRQIDLRLAEKILSPGERQRFDRAEDKRLALLKLWVLKEADAKRTGEGLRGYPKDTNFSPEDPRLSLREGCLLAVIEEDTHAV